ncbi:P-loop NTPase fold protein [Flavobacterium luteolum]|uniref:P-loop NTPase fold protein n=1 Tax=Flavobacterium luteolum TaxID=3003259 RepID=UPI00248E2B9E|nr:P-loop NTPase fold protein [Flavobacterium luteolum]
MFFFFFNENIQVKLGASPKDADVAIVSINSEGAIGELNQMVLRAYGYDQSILKQLNLGKGFDLFQLNGKPILFVVTVGIGNPINNLNENLKQAIRFHIQTLSGKKIWLPLMATGIGNLSYSDSYKITIKVLEETKNSINNSQFIISIPNDKKGEEFYQEINVKNSYIEIDETNQNKIGDSIKVDENLIIKKFINNSGFDFYLVGSNWGNSGDQSNRFYQNNIWENGYEDGQYSEIINNIKEGDFVILKSTYATKDGKNYLRFKGLGLVIDNLNNGINIKVNWIIKNKKIDIKGLSFYRDTITTPNLIDLENILSSLDYNEIEKIINANSINLSSSISNPDINHNITSIPGLLCDSETGEDHLDIKKDVEAFARVMVAKSFIPPLAIALLGKWGSGKSFFMHKLKEDIQKLSLTNPQNAFCEGIAHVHFNAWSYMDANLWASIVTRIFEGLQEYISGDNKAKNFKKEIEKKLAQNLNIAKDEISFLEKQNKIINTQLFGLYRQQINSKRELKKKISTIKQNTLEKVLKNVNEKFKVKSTIEQSLNENPTFIKSTKDLANIVPEKYWISPDELCNQVQSKYTFIKVFFKRDKWLVNTIWLIGILLIIYLTPIFTFTTSLLASWQDFSFTAKTLSFIILVGNFWKRAVDTYNKLQPLIASFWKIKENYETEKADALFKFKQREKALSFEITNSKEEIKSIEQQISSVKEIKNKIKFKLENALSTEALYTFIEKRANSEDYKKHLGIVSVIRKDFEVLSDLLIDHNIEASKNKESDEFKSMFEKPLERIILYIDDLDRCPEERVVEVLEAVNLLMAFPLFVVVVGVDPRWVKTALQKKYKNLFNQSSENEEAISPSNYLEKIFQVPFHLKEAEDNSIKNMIEKLAKTKHNLGAVIKKDELENNTTVDSIDLDSIDVDKIGLDEKEEQKITKPLNIPITPIKEEIINEEQIRALDITDEEIEQIKSLTEIIGNNPRAIKRFLNIYRIVKTHEDFDYKDEIEEKELLAIMFLLALPIGKFKDLIGSFEYFLGIKTLDFSTLDHYVNQPPSIGSSIEENKLKRRKTELKMILENSNKKTLEIDVSLFRKHNSFIKRFTYNNI